MWTVVFITCNINQSLVEACLKRSLSLPLEVTVEVSKTVKPHPSCTCNRDRHGRLHPNEANPCQWHFAFETLRGHSRRIHVLTVSLLPQSIIVLEVPRLENCRLFTLPFAQLTNLKWRNNNMLRTDKFLYTPLLYVSCSSKDTGMVG